MPFRCPITVLLLLLLLPVLGLAQAATRLVLKDGSYQIVTKYELQGDRVHYFSAERNEWEDVPSDMVNWEATRQYSSDTANGKNSPAAKALAKEMEQESAEEEKESPTIAPGLRLPPEGGVYALDTYLNEPELLPLDQSSGDVNRHVGRNVLRSAINPISGSKRTVELAGPSAKVQVHASVPTFYLNLEPEDEDAASSIAESATDKGTDENGKTSVETKKHSKKKDGDSDKPALALPWDRFRIVRVQVKGDKRIVGAIKTTMTGKVSQQEDSIPASPSQLGEGWTVLSPKEPLSPGEYALVEMLGKEGMNSYVWDFGVHPDAPANLSVIKPVKEEGSRPEPK